MSNYAAEGGEILNTPMHDVHHLNSQRGERMIDQKDLSDETPQSALGVDSQSLSSPCSVVMQDGNQDVGNFDGPDVDIGGRKGQDHIQLSN